MTMATLTPGSYETGDPAETSARLWPERLFESMVGLAVVLAECRHESATAAWALVQSEAREALGSCSADPVLLDQVSRHIHEVITNFVFRWFGQEGVRDWHRAAVRVGCWMETDYTDAAAIG